MDVRGIRKDDRHCIPLGFHRVPWGAREAHVGGTGTPVHRENLKPGTGMQVGMAKPGLDAVLAWRPS